MLDTLEPEIGHSNKFEFICAIERSAVKKANRERQFRLPQVEEVRIFTFRMALFFNESFEL